MIQSLKGAEEHKEKVAPPPSLTPRQPRCCSVYPSRDSLRTLFTPTGAPIANHSWPFSLYMPCNIFNRFRLFDSLFCREQNSIVWKPWDPLVFTVGASDLSREQTGLDELPSTGFISEPEKNT